MRELLIPYYALLLGPVLHVENYDLIVVEQMESHFPEFDFHLG